MYALGNLSSKALSFVLIFFMTYFLTREEIGQYDLILTTISLIVPCVSLQIDSSLLRWLLDNPNQKFKEKIFETVFVLLIFNIGIFSVLFLALSFFIKIDYALFFYLLTLCRIIFPTLQQGTRGIGKNRIYVITSILYTFLYVSFTLTLIYFFKLDIDGVLIANIIAFGIVILFLLFKNEWFKYILFKRPDKKLLKDLLSYSLPLLPNNISWWLIGSSTRYVILLYLGVDENGIFAISYKYPTILLMLSSVFTLAWQEKAIRSSTNPDENNTDFSGILEKYIKLLLGFIILLSACSKTLMKFVDSDFFDAWQYIPILLYAVFLQALGAFYGVGYLKNKKTKGVLYSSIVGGLVTVISSFLLTEKWGLYGISFSILLGYLVLLIFRLVQVRSFLKIDFPFKLVAILSIVFIIVSWSNYIDNIYVFITSLAVGLSLFTYLNYDQLINLKTKILKK